MGVSFDIKKACRKPYTNIHIFFSIYEYVQKDTTILTFSDKIKSPDSERDANRILRHVKYTFRFFDAVSRALGLKAEFDTEFEFVKK